MKRKNQEKLGLKIRFSIRLPRYQHLWLKKRSDSTKGTNNFESMNDIISEAVAEYMGLDFGPTVNEYLENEKSEPLSLE